MLNFSFCKNNSVLHFGQEYKQEQISLEKRKKALQIKLQNKTLSNTLQSLQKKIDTQSNLISKLKAEANNECNIFSLRNITLSIAEIQNILNQQEYKQSNYNRTDQELLLLKQEQQELIKTVMHPDRISKI